MSGVRQSVKKSVNSVNLKENIHLAIVTIVADALGQGNQKKNSQKTRSPKVILDLH